MNNSLLQGENNKEFFEYRGLKKFVSIHTSLLRFFILSFFDFLFGITKIIFKLLLPEIIVLFVALIFELLKVPKVFHENLGWGLASASLGFLSIVITVLGTVRGLNKKYFRENSLRIFGSFKLFGLIDYPFLWVCSFLFCVASFILVCYKNYAVYSCAILSIVYTVLILITFIFLSLKNDKKKFIKYLKNSGAVRIKKRSIKMCQDGFFLYKHKWLNPYCRFILFFASPSQHLLHSSIEEYFSDKYLKKDGNLVANTELLKIYFEICPNFCSSDFDIILLKILIESIHKKLFEYLLKEKEYEIVHDILESLVKMIAKLYVSKYYLGEVCKLLRKTKKVDNKHIEKISCLGEETTKIITYKENLFISLLDSISNCFFVVNKCKANNVYINKIKKEFMPSFLKYRKGIKNSK